MKNKCSRCQKQKTNLLVVSRYKETIYYNCRECNTARLKRYRGTDKGRARVYAAVYKSMEKHADKQKARYILNYAVKRRLIEKPKHCERCSKTKIEGHHDDYSKPLEVRWLCRPHHADVHRELDAIV